MKSILVGIMTVALGAFLSGPVLAGLPAGGKEIDDVAYGADKEQRMDVFVPAHARAAPIVLMVHGGAWLIGDKDSRGVTRNKVDYFLPKGVIFISTNYRLSPKADPVEQARDVARALAYVQHHAAEWGGDASRIVIMGHSAGAHLVALLASDPVIAREQGVAPWLGTVVLDSAALDLEAIMQGSHQRFYDRVFKDDPAFWKAASPYAVLADQTAPMLIVCSTQRDDSCLNATRYRNKAVAFKTRIEMLPVDLTHREINVKLGENGSYTDAIERFLQSLGMP